MYNRRDVLLSIGGAAAIVALGRRASASADGASGRHRLGICIHSYALRCGQDRGRPAAERFAEPRRFLEYCHNLGAGGIQVPIGSRDETYARQLRDRAEAWGMFVEGSSGLPRDRGDLERFETEIVTARNAGATVVRAVIPTQGSGRRYEAYDSAEAFQEARRRGRQALELAEPVMARHHMRLAVENHKDERIPERLETLKAISSEYVGACVDTGNDLSFLEDPMAVVEAYAPWAVSAHLKDMAVQEYDEGFLLAEVPLGEGVLDLPKVVQTLQSRHPEVRFTLEMMTRDPLKIPCLTDRYWAAMGDIPARNLARMLRLVRTRGSKEPLPRVGDLPLSEQLAVEDANVKKCLAYATKLVD